jgi:enoyl-CoA hydratase
MQRLAGLGQTLRLTLSGDMIPASEALAIGLVEIVFEPDELREKTLELAARIASKSPLTLRIAKEAIRAGAEMPLAAGIAYERDLFCLCFSSEDKKEGVEAFLGKRQAEWRGR